MSHKVKGQKAPTVADADEANIAVDRDDCEDKESERIYSVALHPFEPIIAIGSAASLVRIYDMKLHQYIDVLPQMGSVLAVAFSPCGGFLATAGSSWEQETYSITIWNVYFERSSQSYAFQLFRDDSSIPNEDAMQIHGAANLHQDNITALAFRPLPSRHDSCFVLASCSDDQTVRLWQFRDDFAADEDDEEDDEDFVMRRETQRLHNGQVKDVCFSDQGRIMATCSTAREIIVWKFRQGGSALSIHQTVVMSTAPDIPACLSFFPLHQLMHNPLGVDIRQYHLACGTDGSLLMIEVSDTYVPHDTAPIDVQMHTAHSEENEVEMLDRMEDMHYREKQKRRKKKRSDGYVALLRRSASYRTLQQQAEPHRERFSQERERNNFIQVSLMQIEECDQAITAVSTAFHTHKETSLERPQYLDSDDEEDDYSKLAARSSARRSGCMLVLTGGDQGTCSVHCYTTTKHVGQVPFWHQKTDIFDHKLMVSAVVTPTEFLSKTFHKMRYLDDNRNQYFCISGSIDETVRMEKFDIVPSGTQFKPLRYFDDNDKPITLERPLTTYRANEFHALVEDVKRLEAAKEEQEEEIDAEEDDEEFAARTQQERGTARRQGGRGGHAGGDRGGGGRGSRLGQFEQAALMSAGIAPGAGAGAGAGERGARKVSLKGGAKKRAKQRRAARGGGASDVGGERIHTQRRTKRDDGSDLDHVGNPLYNFQIFAEHKAKIAEQQAKAKENEQCSIM